MATAVGGQSETSSSPDETGQTKDAGKIYNDVHEGDLRTNIEPSADGCQDKENGLKSKNDAENEGETFEDALEEIDNSESPRETADDGADEIGDDEKENEERDADEGPEEEDSMTDQQKQESKIRAQENKTKGNEYFKNSEYPEAKEYYTRALQICPKQFAKERAVFYANRAACLVKMDLHKEASEDCTKALDLDPEYIKARLRRAQCYEHEDRLEEALEDYQKVFDIDRSSHVAREALMRLPEQIKLKHEKMKEEMLGKLKDLGNVFLQPFGLSTNNFKMQQDPNTGGYNISFQQ